MYKILPLLFFFSVISQVGAQVYPKEGSKLTYRLIGFLFPPGLPGCKYTIEVADGTIYSEDSFKTNIVKSFASDSNKIISVVPAFGKPYTWRVQYKYKDKKKNAQSTFYHFSTKIVLSVDTNITRLRILKKAETYKDAYVFLDATKALYDMDGMPVWYLPGVDGKPPTNFLTSGNYRVTEQSTITFFNNMNVPEAYEANYNGDVLWKAPNNGDVSGDSTEHYNHEFLRLANGHYMILGGEYVSLKLPGAVDRSFLNDKRNKKKIIWDSSADAYYERLKFATIIEYDSTGKVAWSWKSSGYFKGSDIYNHTNKAGVFDIDDVHENAFYFDEKAKVVYVNFKNISRILKVKYPEGNILKVYGKIYKPDDTGYDNNLFYHQHNCGLSQEGYLYVYNNNCRYKGSLPTLLLMQEPVKENDTLKKVWEYECTTDGLDTTLTKPPEFSSMGGMQELPDRSILGCMADNEYTRIFIVNRAKQTLWSALPERWIADEHKWKGIQEYRAYMITDPKALGKWIWNSEVSDQGK